MKIKSVQVDPKRVKAGPEGGLEEGQFLVYPSTFIRKADAYGDVVAKGAFTRTIKEWVDSGNVLPGLYGHRLDDPDFFVAGATEMGEDDHGWWVKGEFDLESPKGAHVYRLVKGKRLAQLSFAYETRDEGATELDGGEKANELRDLKVYEFSFVPLGANPDTSVVAVKSAVEALVNSKAGRVVSSKNETALREARDAIDSVLSSLGEEDGKADAPASGQDQEKASGEPEAKPDATDEDPTGVKSSVSGEELKADPSVARLAAQAHIYALTMGAEGGLS